MSRQLIIKNFGPINHIELDIRSLNIFIGPQSSGKSTIAKCISFGLWLEKDISLHQSSEHINEEFVRQQFLVYHRLESCVHPDSYMEYRCDFFTFTFSSGGSTISLTNLPPVSMGKVAYIPSERNIVTLPSIASLKMGSDYTRDYLFDWFLLRNKYTQSDAIPLLNLGVKYYYDQHRGDRIMLENGKEISLPDASSGLQSITPLLGFIHYNCQWIYEHEPDISYDHRMLLHQQLLRRLQAIDPSINPEQLLEQLSQGKTIMVNVKDMNHMDSPGTPTDLREVLALYSSQVQKPRYTALIIEEPEQNLFPLTQYELVKYIAASFNSQSENVFVVTTHSPYVMASFNNLIEAHHVVSRLGNSVWSNGINQDTAIDPTRLAAYSLHDGLVSNIFDDEVELISAEALDSVSCQIESDFNQLLAL